MTDCVFCPGNWDNLDIVERNLLKSQEIAIIRPLNPVTDGHVLVISSVHSRNATVLPWSVSSALMSIGAAYIDKLGIQANIITSIGPDATQTVFHTHLHVVPRRPGDRLPLPWTLQQMRRDRESIIEGMLPHPKQDGSCQGQCDTCDARERGLIEGMTNPRRPIRPEEL